MITQTDNAAVADTPPKEEAPKKQSWGAKAILALAFSTVGAKLSILGTVADVSQLMKGENVTFRDKMKGVTDGTLLKRMAQDVEQNMAATGGNTRWNMIKAVSKTFKYTIASTAVFMGGGAVLGWMRGGRVESVKDIFVHPIQSTKLVLGIGEETKKPEHAAPEQLADDERTVSWADRTGQKTVAAEMAR